MPIQKWPFFPTQSECTAMAQEFHIDYTDSQIPVLARRLSGGSDNYLYAGGHVFSVMDPQYPEGYPPLAGLHSLIFERTDGSKG